MNIINPATEEVIDQLTEDTAATLARKLQELRTAQPAWANKPLQERQGVINRFMQLLEREEETLALTLTKEMGKPIQQSRNEIKGAIGRIKWLHDHAEQYLADEVMQEAAGLKELISYEPLGVICNISAWNYPYLVGVNVFIPALLAGNAVLYKPSELTTLTGLHIAALLKQAGLPDLFQVAVGGKEVGSLLLDLPFDGYFFTGSHRTGQLIYEKVAAKMVPCQLELGGKDPIYITEDIAAIDLVAEATADGAFYNNGQSCCSVERIYVHEKIYDAYLEIFIRQVRDWSIGDPLEEGIYFGPISRKQQLDILEKQVADAVAKGAKVLRGGKRRGGKGYYFEPTVLVDVNHDMLVMREESFGPIIGIMKVRDDQEALKLMQDTPYGLTAGIYADHLERAEPLLKALNVGSAYWNCCDRVSAAVPWSGRKHSGIGATLSHQGIRAFTKPKAWHLKG